MHNIFICFSTSDTWYGYIIRKLTHSTVNHVFIEFSSNDWINRQAIQVDEDGIHQIPASKIKYKKIIRYTPSILYGELVTSIRNHGNYIGAKYDFLGIFGILLTIIVKWITGRIISSPCQKANKMFCSEFVTDIVKEAGYPETYKLDPASTSPETLKFILDTSPNWDIENNYE
jgi:hypothetical protein